MIYINNENKDCVELVVNPDKDDTSGLKNYIKLNKDIKIKAKSCKEVNTALYYNLEEKNGDIIILKDFCDYDNYKQYIYMNNVYKFYILTKRIYKNSNDPILLDIINISDEDIIIEKGTVIGVIYPLCISTIINNEYNSVIYRADNLSISSDIYKIKDSSLLEDNNEIKLSITLVK